MKVLDDGRKIAMNAYRLRPVSKCFVEYDLYSTFFADKVSDQIESILFGAIDDRGARAVRAYITNNPEKWREHFQSFFEFIDAQKIRTPKGLSWISKHYDNLTQNELMVEMANIRNMHVTIWTEGVREIVSAKDSDIKFITSDHPVTTYNYALPPTSAECLFPEEPDIALKATQTIFPLDLNHCLILTNLEYAQERDGCVPLEKREYSQKHRSSLVRTDQFINSRNLTRSEVSVINSIIKTRARKHIVAGEKEWLLPENEARGTWADFRTVVMPPNEPLKYPGEIYIGYAGGRSDYQDAFGRRHPENKCLRKEVPEKLKPRQSCGCGSGRQFRNCCRGKAEHERPSWKVLSIRERNLALCRGIRDILGFHEGKDRNWNDVRQSLSGEQVKKVYELYGFLWPVETEIMELLPKPDSRLRAVYSGLIDPRVLPQNAISLSLYFDEIFIQSPFVNPNSVRPEFSPVENPNQYRREALKHFFLVLELEPFIRDGFINFIPDICNFDRHLQEQMLDMAKQRSKLLPINDGDLDLVQKLCRQDLMYMLPRTVLKQEIQTNVSDIDEQGVEAALARIEELKAQDPFILLDESEDGTGDGQLLMSSFAPNFEISLFLAQVTGSVLLTDNKCKWKEMLYFQRNNFRHQGANWDNLLSEVQSIKLPVNAHAFRTLDLRMQGKFERMRLALKNLCRFIRSDPQHKNQAIAERNIIKQLRSGEKIALSENDAAPISHEFDRFYDKSRQNHCSFKFFAPRGGIQSTNSQRMLLSRGGSAHLDHVSIAILVEHNWNYKFLMD